MKQGYFGLEFKKCSFSTLCAGILLFLKIINIKKEKFLFITVHGTIFAL